MRQLFNFHKTQGLFKYKKVFWWKTTQSKQQNKPVHSVYETLFIHYSFSRNTLLNSFWRFTAYLFCPQECGPRASIQYFLTNEVQVTMVTGGAFIKKMNCGDWSLWL